MERSIVSSKTFRYEIVEPSLKPTRILFVLHGYGQLAKYFIRKFTEVSDDFLIVAPEGMHRFYLNGSSGRVGASWMTKEARELDIEDNYNWLEELAITLRNEYGIDDYYVLGFSQGGATAARWYNKSSIGFKALILWACVYPPDLKPTMFTSAKQNNWFVIGDEDEFYNGESKNELVSFYKSMDFSTLIYSGKHDIQIQTLKKIFNSILKVNYSEKK